jgi:hypothetical protein
VKMSHQNEDNVKLSHQNTLKTEINRNCLYRSNPYRAVSTLPLIYTNQPVNAVSGNNRCVFSDPHKTHKHTVWAECIIIQ